MTPPELPRPFKDFHYLFVVAWPSLSKMTEEMSDEIKAIRREFDVVWTHLKTAMALIYDGVYTEEELDMAGMKARIKDLHTQLVTAGWGVTEMQNDQ